MSSQLKLMSNREARRAFILVQGSTCPNYLAPLTTPSRFQKLFPPLVSGRIPTMCRPAEAPQAEDSSGTVSRLPNLQIRALSDKPGALAGRLDQRDHYGSRAFALPINRLPNCYAPAAAQVRNATFEFRGLRILCRGIINRTLKSAKS